VEVNKMIAVQGGLNEGEKEKGLDVKQMFSFMGDER